MTFLDEKLIELKTKAQAKKNEIAEQVEDQLTRPMEGATAMEYVLIVSIMAAVIIFAWRTKLGPAIKNRMTQVSNEITSGV